MYSFTTQLLLQYSIINLMGMYFPHHLGFAVGFDKNPEVFHKIGSLGFSFIEVGSATPKPQQPGNPKPWVFRLTEEQALHAVLFFKHFLEQFMIQT